MGNRGFQPNLEMAEPMGYGYYSVIGQWLRVVLTDTLKHQRGVAPCMAHSGWVAHLPTTEDNIVYDGFSGAILQQASSRTKLRNGEAALKC